MIFINGIILFQLYLHEILSHMFRVEMCVEYLKTMVYNGFIIGVVFKHTHLKYGVFVRNIVFFPTLI